MRILYSHRTRSGDGQAVHIEALTAAMAARGEDVLICGPDGRYAPGAAPRRLTAKGGGSPLKRLPSALYEMLELGYSAPAYRRLSAAAKAHAPDILYERYNLFFHASALLAKRRGLPLLLEVNAPLAQERSIHGDLQLKALAHWSERSIWQAADAVFPVTQVLADQVIDAGVPPDRVHVIPNAVDAAALTPGNATAIRERYQLGDALVIGFTGFVREWHRVDRAIRWLGSPEGRHAHLLIVGDGPAVPTLEAYARDLRLHERVTITGVVPREQVIDHVAAFDIALQPAVTAYASPLKLQEYMAQGKAILAPSQPNILETVTPDVSALCVPPDDEAAFLSALTALASDETLRARLGAAAKQTLQQRDMTWTGNAEKILAVAMQLLRD